MDTKLNKKVSQPKTVQAVAAKHELKLGVSANGNLQFQKEPLQHLYELAVSTMFGKDTYYQSGNKLVQDLRKEVRVCVMMGQLDFIANLAIHARTEMNMRTIPIVMVVEFAQALREQNMTYPHMRELVRDVIQRADQINDLYAYSLTVFGSKKAVPMAIKRGVGDAFNKFGEYNFAKYNRDTAVKFKDVLRIVHPVAKDIKQGQLFQKIMEDTLQVPYTWETELSINGQKPFAEQKTKAQLWSELVVSEKLGYMALLRNLRNIAQAGVDPSIIRMVADKISDPAEVDKSKQLLFDFVEAYEIIKPLNSVLATAVSKAIDASVRNLNELGEKIAIIIDYSGSMGINNDPAIRMSTLLAAGLLKANAYATHSAVILFGSGAITLNGVDTNNSVLAIQQDLLRYRCGNIAGSTNFDSALDELSKLSYIPDTIIVFTDGEVNHFPYRKVKQGTGKSQVKLIFDMHSAPTTPLIKQDNWYYMAGWSTGMFRWIPAIRNKVTVADMLSVPYMGVPSKKITY